jgi:hypothetical protein
MPQISVASKNKSNCTCLMPQVKKTKITKIIAQATCLISKRKNKTSLHMSHAQVYVHRN